ncbi:hypothetical protein HNR42_003368 [Deinobacterium chartae]|uniref:DUF4388 domain-containing protein n=1 Tax=Deinobacterium chartae TaxID=521158 RepID=A0A841I619_9DEIO|nr:hypothetical protein [Deinobacterium chartae]MBB6099908.1 hypothetical protein [Deinobacterium chartae]
MALSEHAAGTLAEGDKPFMVARQEDLPFTEFLAYMVGQRMTGCVVLHPNSLKLHLRDGSLEAVEGGEPLGQILLRERLLNEDGLVTALREGGLLGQTLLRQGMLNASELSHALNLQARIGLSYALKVLPQSYELYRSVGLPAPHAGVQPSRVLIEALIQEESLPLNLPFRLAPQPASLTLQSEEWAVLRWMNGRRTLVSALQLSGLDPDRAREVSRTLFARRLLEPSAIVGLKLVVARRRVAGSAYHPPAAIQSNLFLKALNGQDSAWQIGERLRFRPEETATLLASLTREGLIEILRGQREVQRLLEEF